ncbi:14628_t:CDS:2 [Funneliformis geosporum]|uniref:14628_t:CDS:1 n=1 Tax=Funneliformis geosporum TaxID=1117311 RepID=A0A9W4SQ74_9GLOM|nr:14628_t:CDS:2 [Funneliformis geosporum]
MTKINDESNSSLITVEVNEAESVPYDTFVENEALNIDTSFEDNLMSEEGDAATDGGSSLKYAKNLEPWLPEEQKKKHIFLVNWHYRCMAHVLNLIVGAAFEANVIPLPVKKLRTFINMIRNSPKQMNKLKEYFRIESIDFKTPLPDITTRWNFTYFMIERASEIKPLLAYLVSTPFALMTKVIFASSYPTIAQVYEMKRVFDIYFDYINQSLHIPAFFDPRYKKTAYRNMS